VQILSKDKKIRQDKVYELKLSKIMTHKNNREVIDLNPVFTDSSIKIDKVTISHEKSGSSKIKFTVSGKVFSHGVGRLDDELYLGSLVSVK